MADLDFSHSVSEIPQGAQPQPYHRQESVQVTPFPDLQGPISNYAEATNWQSLIGAKVASTASQALATKIGGQLGKNPQGDIGIPLTDFDKTMQQSYYTQAQATLGLQANKLISDSNLEAARADRMTPDLIAKTNQSISLGLKKIFANAPAEVQANLENHYGNLQISQAADMTSRMITEQKQDRKNQASLASSQYAENAHTFGMQGNNKAGENIIATTKQLVDSQVAVRDITPEEAKSRLDSVKQSFYSGKLIYGYQQAKNENKEAEYLKSVADGKIIKTDNPLYTGSVQGLTQFVNQQDALRSQDQSLAVARFQSSVAMNPLAPDMPQQLQRLKDSVSPLIYEKAQLHYISAVKEYNNEQGNVNNALASWNDPSSFARLTEKGINRAFDMQTTRYVQQRQQEGNPISRDEAEVQVAASAGGKVPVFQKSLENKLLSGNPVNIASAANQINMLDSMEAGRAYAGISQKAKAIAIQFQAQRGTMPDTELARQITDNLSNIDEKMQKTLDNSWSLTLSSRGAGGIGSSKSLSDFALQEMNIDKSKLGGNYFATIYGNDIYNQLNSNFMTTRGDYATAKKMTQDYVDQHYGKTYINGSRQITDSPIEKYLGYTGNDITPYIQQDILNQLSSHFAEAKKANPHDYWETLPLKNGVAEVIRNVNGKQFRYPINLVGKAANQWDVVVQTPYGPRNLFLVAPHVGVTTYQPNKEDIDKMYKARPIPYSNIGELTWMKTMLSNRQ